MTQQIDRERLLEWLEVEIDLSSGRNTVEKADRWAFQHVKNAIQSGTFDAPSDDRLRAAAIKLHETVNSYWQGDCDKAAVVNAQSNLCDALSTTTEPTGDENE